MGKALLSASERLIRINLWQKSMLDRGILQIFARWNDRGLGLWYILFFVALDIFYTSQQMCSEIDDGVDAIDDLPCPGVQRKLRRYNSISHQLGTSNYRANHRSSERQTRFRNYSGPRHASSKENFQTTLYGVKADLSARERSASTHYSHTGDPSPFAPDNYGSISATCRTLWNVSEIERRVGNEAVMRVLLSIDNSEVYFGENVLRNKATKSLKVEFSTELEILMIIANCESG